MKELEIEDHLDTFIIGKDGHPQLIKKSEKLLSEIIAELSERFGKPVKEETEPEDESISKFYFWVASIQNKVIEMALHFYLDHGHYDDNDYIRQIIELKTKINID